MNRNDILKESHAILWLNLADEFHHSTKVLEIDIPHHEITYQYLSDEISYPVISGSYMLLAAYSLENLIKLLLLLDISESNNEKNINEKILKLDLISLFSLSTIIDLNNEEKSIINSLANATPYSSRHSVPPLFSQMQNRDYLNDNFVSIYKNLYVRLRNIFLTEVAQVYDEVNNCSRLDFSLEEKKAYFQQGPHDFLNYDKNNSNNN